QREAERESTEIHGALLEAVEGNFDDELGTNVDDDTVVARLELLQLLRLPLEQLVGHSLECLAEHDEPTGGIACAQMKIGQPALPPAVTPLGGEDHEVERVRLFDLEPIPCASTRFVPRVQLFHHQ